MLLKKLVVSGFKSFADKVSLNFGSGITGIVGPNGSGKSNVIDAVRWVMGEQNAKNLRGETATDIIFAGSDKRKSLAMAEVTLTFDNTDQSPFCPPEYRLESEIALTRRLYADGSREYLINRKACRLKDIVGFFATTGLGGRSYSMIQQGQVDRILNAKPEEIREILEEAAGTAVFKARRTESFKRLEATRENLLRVEDILKEVERQLEALKAQVERAKEWRELSTQARQKELDALAFNQHFFATERKRLENEMASSSDNEVQLLSDVARDEARQEELQSLLQLAFPELEAIREEIAAVREQQSRTDAMILASLENREKGGMRIIQIEADLMKEAEDLKSLENEVERAGVELQHSELRVAELKEKIESFQDQVEQAVESARVYLSKIGEIEDELRNLQRLLENNSMKCEANERDRGRIALELKESHERLLSIERELQALDLQAQASESALGESRSGLDVELRLKAELEQRSLSQQTAILAAAELRDKSKERYFELRAKLGSLEDAELSSGDIRQSLVELCEKGLLQPSQSRLLAEGLRFSEAAKELPPAVTAVFERWAERLLLPDLNSLNQLVQAACDHDLGGIPVTLLNAATEIQDDELLKFIDETGAESLAGFVEADKDLPGAKELLARLFFLPSLNLDPMELRLVPLGVTLFSARGVIINGPDSFVVGQRRGRGALSRRAELETTATAFKEAERSLAQSQGEADALQSAQRETIAAIKEIEERLSSQNKDVLGVMAQHQSVMQNKSHKEELVRELQKKVAKFEESDRDYRRHLELLGETRISLGQEKESLQKDCDSIREESSDLDEQRQEVMRVEQNMRLDLAKEESKFHTLRDQFSKSRGLLERMQAQVMRRYGDKARIEEELANASSTEENCRLEAQALVSRREELEERLAVERESSSELHEEQRAVEKRVRAVREVLSRMQDGKSTQKMAAERFRIAIAGIEAQALEKYQVEIGQWPRPGAEGFDPDAVIKEVTRLRRKMEELGAINMVAVEEYDQLSQRREFMATQRDEILDSIAVIEGAIAEVDLSAKERFLATFEVIHANFTELFPILFPGGEGRLELGSVDDPLNSTVDIMVRLPGKKPGRMSLFSGGEKALTAISLIFALLKTKPTPFCFLDEVDAPLDEANVGRYNAVLEALSSRFQFVVITHNRRTMEVLDQLYGVTMQEGGVSKVVGVDLKKDLPVHLQKAFKEEKPLTERRVVGAVAQPLGASESTDAWEQE